jgi:uroporphyrin-3 C-methyltransferase
MKQSETGMKKHRNGKEPSASNKEPSAGNKEPSAGNKEPSAGKNHMSEQDKPGTETSPETGSPDTTSAQTSATGAAEDLDAVEGLHTDKARNNAAPTSKKPPKKKTKALAKTPAPGEKSPATFHVPWVAVLALLLTGAVGYGVYFNYQQLAKVQQTNQSQNASHQTLVDEVAKLRQHLNQTEAHNQQLLDQLNANAQERQVIQQSIDKLSEQLAKQGRGPLQWHLAEVDYLLTIANQRLMLERDVKTAVSALHDADSRLERIGDPALIPIRKQIASEINALNSVQLPDIVGMAVTLQGLVDNIEHLPLISKEHIFKREQAGTEGPVKNWRELPGAIWDDIKSLVTIRHNQEPVERLLPPEQKYYLYQNLALKLEDARIALLQQDSAIFHQDLADTRQWVQRYFDPNAAAVSNVINTLSQLEKVDLKPALPDISASLRALRQWTTAHKTQAALSPVVPQQRTVLPQGADKDVPDVMAVNRP